MIALYNGDVDNQTKARKPRLSSPGAATATIDGEVSRTALLLEAADVGEWDLELNTRVLRRSPKHDECFGYKTAQPGWTLDDVLCRVLAADRQATRDAYEEALIGLADLDCNYRVVWPNGDIHWIKARASTECNESGEACRLVGIVRDVTEFKAVENEVVNVLESMSDAFFSVDKNWIITRVNAQHERSTVYRREEQVGKGLIDLFFAGPEEGNGKYLEHYRRAMQNRTMVQFDDYYEPFDLYTSVRVFPTPDGGLAVFFTDTTEQTKISRGQIGGGGASAKAPATGCSLGQ